MPILVFSIIYKPYWLLYWVGRETSGGKGRKCFFLRWGKEGKENQQHFASTLFNPKIEWSKSEQSQSTLKTMTTPWPIFIQQLVLLTVFCFVILFLLFATPFCLLQPKWTWWILLSFYLLSTLFSLLLSLLHSSFPIKQSFGILLESDLILHYAICNLDALRIHFGRIHISIVYFLNLQP